MLEQISNEEFKKKAIEAIDKVIAQGGKCIDETGRCSYDFNGNKCIVGHMLVRKTTFDGGVRELLMREPDILGFLPTDDQIAKLHYLQDEHDTMYSGLEVYKRGSLNILE